MITSDRGFNYTFKGSNSVSNELIQQRNWKEVVPLIAQLPNTLTGKLGLKTLQVFNVDDPEAREMIIPDEQFMQMQQQAAQQQLEQERIKDERDHQQDLELAIVKGAQKNREQRIKNSGEKPKGMSNVKKASNLETVPATQRDPGAKPPLRMNLSRMEMPSRSWARWSWIEERVREIRRRTRRPANRRVPSIDLSPCYRVSG